MRKDEYPPIIEGYKQGIKELESHIKRIKEAQQGDFVGAAEWVSGMLNLANRLDEFNQRIAATPRPSRFNRDAKRHVELVGMAKHFGDVLIHCKSYAQNLEDRDVIAPLINDSVIKVSQHLVGLQRLL